MRSRGNLGKSHENGGRALASVALTLASLGLLLSGCGGGTSSAGSGIEIAPGPLSGKIGGVAWTIGSAESNGQKRQHRRCDPEAASIVGYGWHTDALR